MTENNNKCADNCICDLIDINDFKEYLESKTTLGDAKCRPIQRRRGTDAEHAEFVGLDGEITVDTTNKTLRVHDGVTKGGSILAKITDVGTGGAGTMPPEISDIDFVALKTFMDGMDAMDYVVASYRAPDGNSWYRKYKSGWIEQGGKTNQFANIANVTLPVAMANSLYTVQVSPHSADTGGTAAAYPTGTRTTTTFGVQIRWGTAQSSALGYFWEVRGLAV